MIDTIVNNIIEIMFGIFLIIIVGRMLWDFAFERDED